GRKRTAGQALRSTRAQNWEAPPVRGRRAQHPPCLTTGFRAARVSSAGRGYLVRSTCRHRGRVFDGVLSDLNINAEGDGFTVIYTAHEVNPACVTILLTGYPAF